MEIAAAWLGHWQNGELSDEVLADRVGELVASLEGARGFFVVSLTSDAPLMDRLPECLVLSLRQAGDGVVDLSARNLAMSTAMAFTMYACFGADRMPVAPRYACARMRSASNTPTRGTCVE
jgi:hypothetical protein